MAGGAVSGRRFWVDLAVLAGMFALICLVAQWRARPPVQDVAVYETPKWPSSTPNVATIHGCSPGSHADLDYTGTGYWFRVDQSTSTITAVIGDQLEWRGKLIARVGDPLEAVTASLGQPQSINTQYHVGYDCFWREHLIVVLGKDHCLSSFELRLSDVSHLDSYSLPADLPANILPSPQASPST
jgi:hypothetical protein